MSAFDYNVLEQLTRIANSLEKIERKLPEQPILTENELEEIEKHLGHKAKIVR